MRLPLEKHENGVTHDSESVSATNRKIKIGNKSVRSGSVFSAKQRSKQLSVIEHKQLETEQERLSDELRYKMLFGTIDFEFKKKKA